MLVLKRKLGETVVIGDEIQVKVLGIEGETVKLGFVAPKNIEILREEIYQSIREENMKAGNQKIPTEELMNIIDTLLNNKNKK